MSNPLVSILILNYNNSKLLKRSINSCINQNYKKIEILIYDDKSQDNSAKVLKKINNTKVRYFLNKAKKLGIPALDARNGYNTLIKKSKGEIIFLLDSDDYFQKNKVKKITNIFKEKKIDLIQDLPLIKFKNKIEHQKNSNNLLSFFPYFAPESCISFRKNFIKNFEKDTKIYSSKFEDVWLGFRLNLYAYYIKKSFFTLSDHLTVYEAQGESKKYQTFGFNWFKRRKNSYNYLIKISKHKIDLKYNLDFVITKLVFFLLNIFK